MPAKRNPKKKPHLPPKPSLVEVTPPDLDAIAVAPVTPPAGLEPAPAPKAGPPQRGVALAGSRGRAAGNNRRYAFRRS